MPSDPQKDPQKDPQQAPQQPQKAAGRQDRDLAFELLARVPYGRVATSMRALPFLASARHIVTGGRLLLRMHRGFGYHEACIGSVVAYGADNLGQERPEDAGRWSVQCVGTCEQIDPTRTELDLFGPAPHSADDEPFTPVYLHVAPQFVTVHELRGDSSHYGH